jgi:hypothetical protein
MARSQRKLRNYLINRGVQLRVTLYMLVVVVLLYGVLGHLYWSSTRDQYRMLTYLQGTQMLLSADDPEQSAYLQEAQKFLKSEDHTRVVLLFSLLVLLVAMLFLGGIYLTHRIAGPVHAASLHLERMAQGQWRLMHEFRAHDQFTFLKDNIDAVVKRVHEDTEADLEVLRALEGEPLSEEGRERVLVLISRKQRLVKPVALAGFPSE